ncbi:MAG: sodium:solute symporter [Dehalococcoidia bacterium]|nr:MAG: sodium:solute symporter [Dehalococcoidia bacterium]
MDTYNIPLGIGVIVALVIFLIVGFAMIALVRKSGKRFVIAGKQLPFFLVGTMLLAQALDANATLGNAGGVFSAGFFAGFQFPLGLALCLLVCGIWFAKPLNRMNLITLPDFYYRRFNRPTEVVSSILMTVSFIILVAGNLAGCAWIMSTLFPISFIWALVGMASVVFLYTLAGGLFACASTDIAQIYPAMLAFFTGVIWMLIAYGGWGYFAGAIPAGYFDFSGLTQMENGALLNWAGILALAIGDVVALDFMERIFAARDPETAQKSCFYGAGFTLLIGLAASVLGLMAFKLLPAGVEDYRMVLPILATGYMPFVVGLFIMIGVVAAGLSTADGGMLGVSSVWGRNIIQRNIIKVWKKEYTPEERASLDKRLLIITRLMGIPVMACAVTLAWYMPEPGIMLVLAFDVVFAGCLVPLVLGLYWKKANSYGALTAMIVGTVLRVVLFFTIPEHLAGADTLIPPVVCLVVMVIVCLYTQKQDPPKHEVIYETPDDVAVLSTKY